MTTESTTGGTTDPIRFVYTNWRGETAERRVSVLGLRFGATDWHPEPQWLLRAIDLDKDAEREFAIADIAEIRSARAAAVIEGESAGYRCGWKTAIEAVRGLVANAVSVKPGCECDRCRLRRGVIDELDHGLDRMSEAGPKPSAVADDPTAPAP